jgi:hypothetical protein
MTETQPSSLQLHGVEISDTFAEAFPIKAARLIITADSLRWATTAATVMCGNATSVIACDVEAAIERSIPSDETPDGRPGVSVLVFAFSIEALLVLGISADYPFPNGSYLSTGHSENVSSGNSATLDFVGHRSRIHTQRNCDHHPRRSC